MPELESHGWSEYRQVVLQGLQQLSSEVQTLHGQVTELRIQVEMQKQRTGWISLLGHTLGGALTAIAAIIYVLLQRG